LHLFSCVSCNSINFAQLENFDLPRWKISDQNQEIKKRIHESRLHKLSSEIFVWELFAVICQHGFRNKSIARGWNLSSGLDVTLMTFGTMFNIVYLAIWIGLLIFAFVKFYKILMHNSIFYCLKIGLNQKSWFLWLFYYVDYFAFWIIILILLAISPSIIVSWSIILGVYLIEFILFLFPIYQSIGDRIICSINSIHLLMVIVYFLVSEKLTYQNEDHKWNVNEIFMKIYISFTGFVTLIMIGRMILNVVILIKYACLSSS